MNIFDTLIIAIPSTINWFFIYSLLVVASIIAIRVGVFCLAVEGIFMISAFATAILLNKEMLPLFSISLAVLSGLIVGLIFVLLAVKLELDEIIVGISINLFCIGFTSYVLLKYYLVKYLAVNNGYYLSLPLAIISLILISVSYYILDKSVYKNRFIAIGDFSNSAALANLSVFMYRNCSLLMTSILASVAGVYFSISQKGFSDSQWSEGIGFLAIGVGFATRNSIFWGIIISLVLAMLRTLLAFNTNSGGWGIFRQISPYIFMLVLFALMPLFKKNALHKSCRNQLEAKPHVS